MAIFEILSGAILSVVLTVPTMILLYHKWIIPKVIVGVKQDLPPAIIAVVDEKITDVKEYIAEQMDSARMALIGKIGGKMKGVNAATRYLARVGVTEDSLNEILDKYGEETLRMISEKVAKLNTSGGGSAPEGFGKISE